MNAQFIKIASGRTLLMVNKYTYWQSSSKKVYYCSRRHFKCMSSVKLDNNDDIIYLTEKHNHPPPVYKNVNGIYIKIM